MRLKGPNRVCFTSSDRAIVREPQGATVSTKGIGKADKEIAALVALAIEQKWEVDPNGSRLAFKPADKTQSIIYVSRKAANGSGYKNDIARLQRAGLDVSSLKKYADSIALTPDGRIGIPENMLDSDEKKVRLYVDKTMDNMERIDPEMAAVVNEVAQATGAENAVKEIVTALVGGLGRFAEELKAEGFCTDCKTEELEKAENLYLEAEEARSREAQRAERLEAEVSRLGSELRDALAARDEALEAANKAKNKLRMFREALQDD